MNVPINIVIPQREKNKYSTETAIYSVTKIIDEMIQNIILSIDELSDVTKVNKSVYFSEHIPEYPTEEDAISERKRRTTKDKITRLNGSNKKNFPKAPRSLRDYYYILVTLWKQKVASSATKIFKKGIHLYLDDGIIYESTVHSLQHFLNILRNHGVGSDFHPRLTHAEMLEHLRVYCSEMFNHVYFEGKAPFPTPVAEKILELGKELKRANEFVKLNLKYFPPERIPFGNMKSPSHWFQLWEL